MVIAPVSISNKTLTVLPFTEPLAETKETYSFAGTVFAEASYSTDGKPLKLVKYENGEVVTRLDYTVAAESIAVTYLLEGNTVSLLFSLNENGRPQSMTASVIAGESVGASLTGEWKYAGNYCESLVMTSLADGTEMISEYLYEYDTASFRVKTSVTRETYEEQKLLRKRTEEYAYYAGGMLSSVTARIHNGVIVRREEKMVLDEYGNELELHLTEFDEGGRKTYTAIDTLLNEEDIDKTTETFFDANGNITSSQLTDYTYNNSGKCVKKEQTLYDADNKAKTKTIFDYDAYGNVLLREEITYTYLGSALIGTSYTKYDGDGNVIDSGVRK